MQSIRGGLESGGRSKAVLRCMCDGARAHRSEDTENESRVLWDQHLLWVFVVGAGGSTAANLMSLLTT